MLVLISVPLLMCKDFFKLQCEIDSGCQIITELSMLFTHYL